MRPPVGWGEVELVGFDGSEYAEKLAVPPTLVGFNGCTPTTMPCNHVRVTAVDDRD